MAVRLANNVAIAACDAVVALFDAGAGPGYYEIRTGTQPAGPDSAATGTLLVTITMSDPAYGSATDANPGGVSAINGTPSGVAVAAGTAGWFRSYDSNDNPVYDGLCSGTGGGASMELDNTTIEIGQTATITSSTITMPEA